MKLITLSLKTGAMKTTLYLGLKRKLSLFSRFFVRLGYILVYRNRIPKRVLYMNLETRRLRGRPRNMWQDEVREGGRMVVEKSGRKKYMTGRNGRSS
jgi:hypothetical protein